MLVLLWDAAFLKHTGPPRARAPQDPGPGTMYPLYPPLIGAAGNSVVG